MPNVMMIVIESSDVSYMAKETEGTQWTGCPKKAGGVRDDVKSSGLSN